jgi:[ribosomal protein S18]-alanine N-acetyltransferase
MIARIEPMSRAAAGPVSVLQQDCFPEDPWDMGDIERIMEIPGFFGLVGSELGSPIGFAFALAVGGEAEILSLGVQPGCRRAGMGSALLAATCSEARRRGAEAVVLEVATVNQAARKLYAAQGFTMVGRRRNYYRKAGRFVDALILRVPLIAHSSVI